VDSSVSPPVLRATSAPATLLIPLVALVVLAWLIAADRMAGMDEGAFTDPGTFGFFVSLWVVMMAAMMLPSAAPMVMVHAAVERRKRQVGRAAHPGATLAFASGYLLAWTAYGLLAYALFQLLRSLDVEAFSSADGERYLAAALIAVAAVYQLTPLKNVCLKKCRSPLAFVVGSWRDGRLGGMRMGAAHGGWCVGCCWAVMGTLFALGLMNLAWMAAIAAMVAVEKLVPWERVATFGSAGLLAVLALLVALGVA
jgi:predicted metal-binding membrane protein